jgi:hypothetical protein
MTTDVNVGRRPAGDARRDARAPGSNSSRDSRFARTPDRRVRLPRPSEPCPLLRDPGGVAQSPSTQSLFCFTTFTISRNIE